MDSKDFDLQRTAFDAYLDYLQNRDWVSSDKCLPYEFDSIDGLQWRVLGKEMIKDELLELTNILNQWQGLLLQWQAWNSVIKDYSENDAWILRNEFLEPLAHNCLLQPSAIRDTFTFIATNSMHQVRLASENDYKDFLEGDQTQPNQSIFPLQRKQKEKRLRKLISGWKESTSFMNSLYKINDEEYHEKTSNYRNLINHSIGPRLGGFGTTRKVTRIVEQASKMTKQSDGKYELTPIPNKMSVSYTFGGTEPLDMEKARILNLEQYTRARECYENYMKLLAAGLAYIPLVNSNL